MIRAAGSATVPARRPPLGRLLLALLIAVPVALGFTLTPVGDAAASNHLARIDLRTLDPAVGGPGATLRATGVLSITGKQVLTDVELRLRLSRTRLNSRGELAAVGAGRTSSRDGDIVAQQQLPGRLTAGSKTAFELAVPLDDVPTLGEFGVHVLSIEAVASSRNGFGRVTVVRTFLPWVPAERDFKPTGFAWLWPQLAAPVRLADGTYADDRLATELAPEGRLGRVTAAGARL